MIKVLFPFDAGGESAADCQPCTGGTYCGTTGLVEPSGNCSRGYYCPDNETISTPTPTGLECWVGYYCLEGSSAPTPCAPRFFSETVGSYACTPCPAGYYCTSGVSPNKIICPQYSYCEEGKCLVYMSRSFFMTWIVSLCSTCDDIPTLIMALGAYMPYPTL